MNRIMETLAERYPSLYVDPFSEGAEEAAETAVMTGMPPARKDLSHFLGSGRDWLRTEETPAGPVEILYLYERADFETFLRIISHRCRPAEILPSVGAQTFIGLRNWKKIFDHKREYLARGGDRWDEEIVRFDADKEKSRDTLILVSNGPYSAVPYDKTPWSEEEWTRISLQIRYYHECSHVICRRTFPGLVRPLWDELTADLTGLRKAVGRYDPGLAALFLGVTAQGYSGGRLRQYLKEGEDPDRTARDLFQTIGQLEEISAGWEAGRSYDLLIWLTDHALLDR